MTGSEQGPQDKPELPARPVAPIEAAGVNLGQAPALAPLLAVPRWCCWRWSWRAWKRGEEHKGAWTKVPWFAAGTGDGEPLSAKHPEHGRPYQSARGMVLRGDADGVGWIVTGDLGRVWFDLDKCRDPDSREIDPWAGAWLTKPDLRGAYMEISPSGRGIHVLGKVVSWTEPRQTRIDVTRLLATLDEQELEARWGGSRKCHPLAAIEIFHACVRYVTVTGWMMEIVREAAP